MQLRLPVVLLVALAAACGGRVDGAPPPDRLVPGAVAKSGSRLRLRVLEASDGSRVPIGFHDAELGVDCSPRADRDGVVRCLPVAVSTDGFADAACSVRAFTPASSACPVRRYVARQTTRCPAPSDLAYFEVGARIEEHFALVDGVCTATPPGAPSYAVGTVDVTDRFVVFREERRPLGARLDAMILVSSDGAEWLSGRLYDRVLDMQCAPGNASDGSRRCLPMEPSPEGMPVMIGAIVFADASCSKPLVARVSECEEPTLGHAHVACVGTRVFRALRPYTGATFATIDGACTAMIHPGSLYEAEELPPSKLAPAHVEHSASGLTVDVFDGRAFVGGRPPLHDPATHESCSVLKDPEGRLRCAPHAAIDFADADCTIPVAAVGRTYCGPPPKRAYLPGGDDVCTPLPGVAAAYAVGDEITTPGPTLFSITTVGTCVGTSATDRLRVFEARPIPLDALPAYRLVTE